MRRMDAAVLLVVTALMAGLGWRVNPKALPAPARTARHRIVFSRVGPVRTGLFRADADGRHEKPLLPAEGLDYNPSFSADRRWIVFTSERAGSADIHRVRPDGTRLERLTDDPAHDDQPAFSPDGSKLVFVSTRGRGRAHLWLLDLHTRRCRNLTDGPGGDFRPSWSPDGKWIAFTSHRGTHPGRTRWRWSRTKDEHPLRGELCR